MVVRNKKRKQAFSLVELMVAVGIISILVSLGLPRYQAFIARARMAEAKVNLGHIASLQGIYRSEWNRYGILDVVGRVSNAAWNCDEVADFENPLGFAPDGCQDLRYGYESTGGGGFTATAKAGDQVEIYPGCTPPPIRDEWQVIHTKLKPEPVTNKNIVKHCD